MKPRAKILVPVAITAVGLAGALILVATRPELDVAPKERVAPLVRVINVVPRDVQLSVRTHGTVAPRTAERDLSERTGVNRGAVREGLRALAHPDRIVELLQEEHAKQARAALQEGLETSLLQHLRVLEEGAG